jgi:hypothetical protein
VSSAQYGMPAGSWQPTSCTSTHAVASCVMVASSSTADIACMPHNRVQHGSAAQAILSCYICCDLAYSC